MNKSIILIVGLIAVAVVVSGATLIYLGQIRSDVEVIERGDGDIIFEPQNINITFEDFNSVERELLIGNFFWVEETINISFMEPTNFSEGYSSMPESVMSLSSEQITLQSNNTGSIMVTINLSGYQGYYGMKWEKWIYTGINETHKAITQVHVITPEQETPPPNPFTVYGFVKCDGAGINGIEVTVTNSRTDEYLTNTTYSGNEDGLFQVNLANMPSPWDVGDIIFVNATYNEETKSELFAIGTGNSKMVNLTFTSPGDDDDDDGGDDDDDDDVVPPPTFTVYGFVNYNSNAKSNATVKATNNRTGIEKTTTSNESGFYTISFSNWGMGDTIYLEADLLIYHGELQFVIPIGVDEYPIDISLGSSPSAPDAPDVGTCMNPLSVKGYVRYQGQGVNDVVVTICNNRTGINISYNTKNTGLKTYSSLISDGFYQGNLGNMAPCWMPGDTIYITAEYSEFFGYAEFTIVSGGPYTKDITIK